MAVHLELRDSFLWNCEPLKTIPIMTPRGWRKTLWSRRNWHERNRNLSYPFFKEDVPMEVIVYMSEYIINKISKILHCEKS